MPTGHFRHYLEHYLAPHPSSEIRELYLSTAILSFATSAVMIFEPIYLYTLGWSLPAILLFFAAVYLLYFLFLPIGGRICRKHGFEHTILWSSPFLILYYICLFATVYSGWFLAFAAVFLTIQKILYWPGYHANFATWMKPSEEGREVSNMSALLGFATALAPALGGLVATQFGFKALFGITAVLILLSNIPLLRTPEIFMPKEFPYFDSIRRLFTRANRRKTLAYLAFGEELIALVPWPIFISLVIPDFASLGIVVSMAMVANILVTLYVGRLCDEGGRLSVLRSGAVFTAASWAVRVFVSGGLGVFLIDSFYRVSKNMLGVPFTAMVYDGAKRNGIVEDVILFEMALSLGKLSAALIAALIFILSPNFWTGIFILAAVYTCLFAFMPKEKSC
jgi:hypothetical protein